MKLQPVVFLTIASILLVSSANKNATESTEEILETKEKQPPKEGNISKEPSTNFNCSDQAVNVSNCPSEIECDKLGNECLHCQCDINCQYGDPKAVAECSVPEGLECTGSRTFNRTFTCSFCYQSEDLQCDEKFDCESVADPQDRSYVATCSVPSSRLCLGRRSFPKQRACNWTGGHRWLTTLILSITLGGFGADRYVVFPSFLNIW